MSWLGLRHKGIEPLYPYEWNLVVDGLDILYAYVAESVKYRDLPKLPSDVGPEHDNTFDLGFPDRRWREVHGVYGYFDGDLFARGSRVLVDGDPVQVYRFIDEAKADIDNIYDTLLGVKALVETVSSELDLIRLYVEQIYLNTLRPTSIETYRLTVGATPVPLSDVDKVVKRIHVKVPSWALYLVYLGDANKQDFILEPGERETLEVSNPRLVYVRSLGTVEVFVMLEE
jgi:hypothetical protein